MVGDKTYKLIRDLVAPKKPMEKSYQQLVELLTTHLKPKPSMIVERFKFNSHFHREGETAAQYLGELWNLACYCEYGQNLDEMLHDQLVCGINGGKIQCRLLSEKELTLKQTWEIIVGMKSAEKYAGDLQQPGTVQPVHTVKSQPNKSELCYRCGGMHKATVCPFKDAECHVCRKKGHIAKVCRSKSKKQSGSLKSEQTHRVDTQESEPTEYTLFTVSSHEPLMVNLLIKGQSLQMELDIGASVCLISEYLYKKLHEAPPLERFFQTYTGENLSILGSIRVTATYNNQTKTLPTPTTRLSCWDMTGWQISN